MDLNEVLHAHQLAVMKIAAGGSMNADDAAKLALYAAQISALHGPAPYTDPRPRAEPDTIILAGYEGNHPETGIAENETWESEGGSIAPTPDILPSGITMMLRPEYRVGPYAYGDLALAKAELSRRKREDQVTSGIGKTVTRN
jgi:hypothetical protein